MNTKEKASGLRSLLAALAIAVGISLVATSCVHITWQKDETFGLGVEVTAARANLVIYRGARDALNSVLNCCGPEAVRDVIWAAGKPPTVSTCVKSYCVSSSAFNELLRSWMFSGDSRLADLTSALKDAQARRNCLAFTFISYAAPAHNWTHKSASCKIGRTF